MRVASTGAFSGLLSGSMEAFGTFTATACLPGFSGSESSACMQHGCEVLRCVSACQTQCCRHFSFLWQPAKTHLCALSSSLCERTAIAKGTPCLGAQGHAEALFSSQRSTATSMAVQWVCPSTMISRMPDSSTSRATSAATAGVAKLPFDLHRGYSALNWRHTHVKGGIRRDGRLLNKQQLSTVHCSLRGDCETGQQRRAPEHHHMRGGCAKGFWNGQITIGAGDHYCLGLMLLQRSNGCTSLVS